MNSKWHHPLLPFLVAIGLLLPATLLAISAPPTPDKALTSAKPEHALQAADSALVIFANSLQNQVCVPDGMGGFTCSPIGATGGDPDNVTSYDVALGDLDSNGYLDAVFANGGKNRVCLGDRNDDGDFITHCDYVSNDENTSRGIALGDLDGDSNLDAVFANFGENQVCLGDGDGSFDCHNVSEEGATSYHDVALGHVDGDSNLDAVFANFGENQVCFGDGDGDFTSCHDVSEDNASSRGVVLVDLDGDGNLDAVFANFGGLLRENRFCAGVGDDTFTCRRVSQDTYASESVASYDQNGDSNPDAVIFVNAGGPKQLCAYQPEPDDFDCSPVSDDTTRTRGVASGDVDGDGNQDAVFIYYGKNQVCLGKDGRLTIPCHEVSEDSNHSNGVALDDVNDDGNLDAVFANEGKNRVCLGDGDSDGDGMVSFDCRDIGATKGGTADVSSHGVALDDVNDDGNLDVVFANTGQNQVCLGDGAGDFGDECTDVGDDNGVSHSVALGDLDGDGYLDVVFANQNENRVCLGDSENPGSFVAPCNAVSDDETTSHGIALGDLDGNDNLDAVFANRPSLDNRGNPVGGQNQWCPGDGDGHFDPCRDISDDQDTSEGIALGQMGAAPDSTPTPTATAATPTSTLEATPSATLTITITPESTPTATLTITTTPHVTPTATPVLDRKVYLSLILRSQ